MDRDTVIALLKRYRQELVGRGVESLALIGSVARDEASHASDVDLVVRLAGSERGFAHFRRLDDIRARLSEILDCRVDLVEDSAVSQRMRREIQKDSVVAF
jgi:predicted nucleotidyltransferase